MSMTSYFFNNRLNKGAIIWLSLTAFLTLLIMVIGAITRLTDSGLSIPDWDLFLGWIPPMSEAAWGQAFSRYKEFSEYQLQNSYFDLEDFKSIYWWEYIHRAVGRLVGIVYAIGLVWYVFIRKNLTSKESWLAVLLLFLGGAQGAVGYWMVASGLADRADVAPLRLVIHMYLALSIMVGLLWLVSTNRPLTYRNKYGSIIIWLFLILLLATIGFGALTAGSDAGYINSHWPLYSSGSLLADGYSIKTSFTDVASIQSNHRNMAYITFIVGIIAAFNIKDGIALFLLALLFTQLMLGIITVAGGVALNMAVSHQVIATTLLVTTAIIIKRGRSLKAA